MISWCWLHRHGIALLHRAIVRPQQPRRHGAPGSPSLGDFLELLRGRALALLERELCCLLQREVTGRKRVGMADARQEINVGGPGADTFQSDQRGVGFIGGKLGERVEIDRSVADGTGDGAESRNLRGRQPGTLQLRRARGEQVVMIEGCERLFKSRPDRRCARRRELLRADDRSEPGNPAVRRRKGGWPASARISSKRGSSCRSAVRPASISASVSIREDMIREDMGGDLQHSWRCYTSLSPLAERGWRVPSETRREPGEGHQRMPQPLTRLAPR